MSTELKRYRQYLERYAFRERLIDDEPNESLQAVVVIPSHNEQTLIPSVNSLQNATPIIGVEVIVVFNASVSDSDEIKTTNLHGLKELQLWYSKLESPNFVLYCILENELPAKHAGVGLARKIGMDEAIRRFEKVVQEGIIICYDADSLCMPNYLIEIEHHFKTYPNTQACSVHFEHPTQGFDFDETVYKGIYYYELHLRYYKNGLAYAGLPFAFHTIGSSMAVQAVAYCEQGGMNRRKAGEDFYFLQKFIDIGRLTELTTTKVIPSPRASNRVPFGTGRAIQEMLENQRDIEKSYAFEIFELLKKCFEGIEQLYDGDSAPNKYLVNFIGLSNWTKKTNELRKKSPNAMAFRTNFFKWFNAFKTLKFIHFLRDSYQANSPLEDEVPKLLRGLGLEKNQQHDLLRVLREVDIKKIN